MAKEIHHAAATGDISELRRILEHDPNDIKFLSPGGIPPFVTAVMKDQVEAAQLLLDAGSEIGGVYHSQSPLFIAAEVGAARGVTFLIEHKADVNWVDHKGRNVLHAAVAVGRVEALPLLWAAGTDINHKDLNGLTPLMHSAGGPHHKVTLPVLLEGKPEINFANLKKTTALSVAACAGHYDAVTLLLQVGADPNMPVNEAKQTPFDLIKLMTSSNHKKCAVLLRNAMDGKPAVPHIDAHGHSTERTIFSPIPADTADSRTDEGGCSCM